MIDHSFIISKFGFLGEDFLCEFKKHAVSIDIKAKTEIIREGQKNKFIPFLIKGSIKVFTLNDGRELIYYYIKPKDSCPMTFSSILKDYISRVYAIADKDSKVILIPVSILHEWLIKFPQINKLFYHEYDRRFLEIMNMINDAVFHKLDKRILNYIKQQISVTESNPLKITHREIAHKLGTSREVVSRVLKKIEIEGELEQTKEGIKLLYK
ncbi:Crp/Fnr family transcriptional regulator [Chryseobacterium sp.]|uniref:Crp/Fnr family transcriptional regulator n=1 Tax=Chryseobacterium sp. TaxID=1871047 RepID=UPI0031E3E3A9